jgi:hypothetical protein
MNHFVAARQESLRIACDTATQAMAKRLCLIFDLQGRIRILAELEDDHDANKIQQMLNAQLAAVAPGFWTGEWWFQRGERHPLGKPSPSERSLFEAVWRQAKPCPEAAQFCSILDRRYSKDGWFDASASPPWPHVETKTPPIVSFYSFKGGVGRSTAMASMAIQCARAGKRVLTVDFDLEAPGLASIFPAPNSSPPDVGILDFLIEYPVAGKAFHAGDIIYVYDQKDVVGNGEIRVAPAGRVDPWYLEKLSRLDYQKMVPNPQLPESAGNSLLHELLNALRNAVKPDVILLDARAGFHDLGGLALSALAHWHVLFGLDSKQSWDGLRLAIAHLGRERVETGAPQRDCVIVQSMAKPQGAQESIDHFRQESYKVFCEEYYDDPSNSNAEWPVPDELAVDQPHYPITLVHDTRVMGFSQMDKVVADYLCEGNFKMLYDALIGKLGLKT